jgi:hypothetical protein
MSSRNWRVSAAAQYALAANRTSTSAVLGELFPQDLALADKAHDLFAPGPVGVVGIELLLF